MRYGQGGGRDEWRGSFRAGGVVGDGADVDVSAGGVVPTSTVSGTVLRPVAGCRFYRCWNRHV